MKRKTTNSTVIHVQQSAQPVHSTNLKYNSGLFQKVFGQGSPHNNSAVEWNDTQNYTLKPFVPGGVKTHLKLNM